MNREQVIDVIIIGTQIFEITFGSETSGPISFYSISLHIDLAIFQHQQNSECGGGWGGHIVGWILTNNVSLYYNFIANRSSIAK